MSWSIDDAAGPRRHHEHSVGEEHGFAQIVGDQDDREVAPRLQRSRITHHSSSRVKASSAPNGSSSISRAAARGSARGTATRAAACRPTVPTETCRRSRRGRPRRQQASGVRAILGLLRRRNPLPMRRDDFERQQHIVDQRGAPGQQVGAWNAMPAIFTGPRTWSAEDDRCRRCRTETAARWRASSGMDLPQPEGPTTAANSPRSTCERQAFDGAGAPSTGAIGVADAIKSDKRHDQPRLIIRHRLSSPCESAAGGRTSCRRQSAAFGCGRS